MMLSNLPYAQIQNSRYSPRIRKILPQLCQNSRRFAHSDHLQGHNFRIGNYQWGNIEVGQIGSMDIKRYLSTRLRRPRLQPRLSNICDTVPTVRLSMRMLYYQF